METVGLRAASLVKSTILVLVVKGSRVPLPVEVANASLAVDLHLVVLSLIGVVRGILLHQVWLIVVRFQRVASQSWVVAAVSGQMLYERGSLIGYREGFTLYLVHWVQVFLQKQVAIPRATIQLSTSTR